MKRIFHSIDHFTTVNKYMFKIIIYTSECIYMMNVYYTDAAAIIWCYQLLQSVLFIQSMCFTVPQDNDKLVTRSFSDGDTDVLKMWLVGSLT